MADDKPDIPAYEADIEPISVADEMSNSFLDYSMSVIISRALPDARDGLKPSQRRILLAMNDPVSDRENTTESAPKFVVILPVTTTHTVKQRFTPPLSTWLSHGRCGRF